MKQFVLLTSILMSTLAANTSEAQLLNEIIRGSVLDMPSDVFACNGNDPCNLTYRMYPGIAGHEVNGPANPVDGIPRFNSTFNRYQSDAQTTINFPIGGGAGPGNEWYIVWDGITDSGTADHAGWYGGQSQIISYNEIGNSLSANCLPVIAAEACFAGLSAGSSGGTSTTRADGSSLSPIGGMAPIPCPTINGPSPDAPGFIDVSWNAATNYTARDGAGSPITGYKLLWITNPASAPTDIDWATVSDSASFSSTSGQLDLAGLGLADGDSITAAIRLQYAGGQESTQVSCNSNNYVVDLPTTDVCIYSDSTDEICSVDLDDDPGHWEYTDCSDGVAQGIAESLSSTVKGLKVADKEEQWLFKMEGNYDKGEGKCAHKVDGEEVFKFEGYLEYNPNTACECL